MDRDDMRDNIERATSALGPTPEQARARVIGKHPSLAAPYGGDIRVLAASEWEEVPELLPNERPGSPAFARLPLVFTESPPCEAFALRPAIADGEVATCPSCVEFGTICRPCRKERYEAGLARRLRDERRETHRRVRVALMGGLVVFLVLSVAQIVLDHRCGASKRWSTDTLACEVRR